VEKLSLHGKERTAVNTAPKHLHIGRSAVSSGISSVAALFLSRRLFDLRRDFIIWKNTVYH